jgi:hypothetical protein
MNRRKLGCEKIGQRGGRRVPASKHAPQLSGNKCTCHGKQCQPLGARARAGPGLGPLPLPLELLPQRSVASRKSLAPGPHGTAGRPLSSRRSLGLDGSSANRSQFEICLRYVVGTGQWNAMSIVGLKLLEISRRAQGNGEAWTVVVFHSRIDQL